MGHRIGFVIYRHIKTSPFFVLSLLFLFNNVESLSIRPINQIVWSTKNKMFDIKSTSTDKSVKYGQLIHVRIGEFLNIFCPKYSENDYNKYEYHTVYHVSKKEYDECRIDNIHNKVPILKCDRPNENVKYTLYISNFSPVPDAIEFTPGSSYYFISTSDGSINGVNNSENGTCKTHNMKIVVKVLDSQNPVSTKKSQLNNNTKFNKNLKITSKKNSSTILNTQNLNLSNMKISSSFVESPSTNKSNLHSSSTTPTTISTARVSKTVDDNIFILEPETIDYNDILSQLISTSANNSNVFNDKKIYHESYESGHLNNAHSYLLINISFKNYIFCFKLIMPFMFFFKV